MRAVAGFDQPPPGGVAALAGMGYGVPGVPAPEVPEPVLAAPAPSTGFSTGFSSAPPMMGVATGGAGTKLLEMAHFCSSGAFAGVCKHLLCSALSPRNSAFLSSQQSTADSGQMAAHRKLTPYLPPETCTY